MIIDARLGAPSPLPLISAILTPMHPSQMKYHYMKIGVAADGWTISFYFFALWVCDFCRYDPVSLWHGC